MPTILPSKYPGLEDTLPLRWADRHFGWTPKMPEQGAFLAALRGYFMGYRRFLWVKGRQTGFTEATSLAALYAACEMYQTECNSVSFLEHIINNAKSLLKLRGFVPQTTNTTRGSRILVVSADTDKVYTIFTRALKFIEGSDELRMARMTGVIAVQRKPYPAIIVQSPQLDQPAVIEFRSIGSNHLRARKGKGYDYIFVDEAAYCLTEVLSHVIWTGAKMYFLSGTPNGRDESYFEELAHDPYFEFNTFTVDTYQNPNYTLALDDEFYHIMDHRTYSAEIQANFRYDPDLVEYKRNMWRESKKAPK